MAKRNTSQFKGDRFSDDTQDTENDIAALREGNERYHLLMELVADGIIIVQDGIIKEINPSMAKLSGYGPEAMLDTALTGYFPPDENPALETMIDSPESGSSAPQVREATLVCKNGRRLKAEITAAGCTLQQEPATLLIIKDISDRLTARESSEKAGKLEAIAALSRINPFNCWVMPWWPPKPPRI